MRFPRKPAAQTESQRVRSGRIGRGQHLDDIDPLWNCVGDADLVTRELAGRERDGINVRIVLSPTAARA